jgi:hypothetical protein
VDAQNARIWTASVVTGIEPNSAHIGGSVRAFSLTSLVAQRDVG